MRSPRVANAPQNVQRLRPGQLLREFALEQVQAADSPQQAERMAKLIVVAGRELFGHLQVALQGVRLCRQVLPACQGNGFEAWWLLRERFRPQTSGGMIAELQETILNNLYKAGNFEL
eukprot:1232826-Alexandrium_andersonii.AAC.1